LGVFSGHYYGTSKRSIAEQPAKGLVVLLGIEIEGMKRIKTHPELNERYVFIEPPSMGELGPLLREVVQKARRGFKRA
jgi:guanylate kinase